MYRLRDKLAFGLFLIASIVLLGSVGRSTPVDSHVSTDRIEVKAPAVTPNSATLVSKNNPATNRTDGKSPAASLKNTTSDKTFFPTQKASKNNEVVRHNVLGSNEWWRIEYNEDVLSCEIGSNKKSPQQHTEHSLETAAIGSTTSLALKNKFLIHVHGLQHTGTGYLRMLIHDILGGDSNASLHHAPVYEDEGQHLQTIYPRGHHRMSAWKKSQSRNVTQFLYVSDLCHVPKPLKTGEMLMQQWSQYWNMSQYYLIQKTPFMDVGFLERIKILPTFHAIVMRHPMVFNKFLAQYSLGLQNPIDSLLIWLDSWVHTLGLLADGQIDSYAVVTYESIVLYKDVISNDLLEVIQQHNVTKYKSKSNTARHYQRRLELHKGKDSSKYLEQGKPSIFFWNRCLKQEKCKRLFQDINKYVFSHMGYYSDNTQPHSVYVGEEFGRLLFSPVNPPSLDLVRKMKELLTKYS